MEENVRPKTIFEQILEGVRVNNEILVGLADDVEIMKAQQKSILSALYPALENDTEPTALGSETL